mmetsp:Transcript_22522/g.90294  ORF Transcript_22522/g.90294 Transcript_22522/m.90294 type:complete len:86 (+) Transcript_22522:1629-1886(+)
MVRTRSPAVVDGRIDSQESSWRSVEALGAASHNLTGPTTTYYKVKLPRRHDEEKKVTRYENPRGNGLTRIQIRLGQLSKNALRHS